MAFQTGLTLFASQHFRSRLFHGTMKKLQKIDYITFTAEILTKTEIVDCYFDVFISNSAEKTSATDTTSRGNARSNPSDGVVIFR